MAKYECEHCGMGVADMKCAKCEHEYTQPFTLNATDFFA